MKKLLFVFALLCTSAVAFAQTPQIKIDYSLVNRSDDETLEPGFTVWRLNKEILADSMTIDGVKIKVYVPTEDGNLMRLGWDKTTIQKSENKEKNARLTIDGLNLENDPCGRYILRLEGLPKGSHTIQTYHNSWNDGTVTYGYPMTVKCNGKVVHENIMRTFREVVSANACLLTTTFTIANDGDAVELEFSTSEDNPGTGDATHTKVHRSPVLNGFELNTVNVASQAKTPDPNYGNIHVDADNGEYTLSWSPANSSVKQHLLYVATDSVEVENMVTPTATKEYADTTYHMTDLYDMNTYWWRVDEVDAAGNVTKGNMWYFRPRHLAFPGAEGYGRFAQGGRGGVVYHVTNLTNDMTPGSFIYGLKGLTGPRTIVFDVSGIITMSSKPTESIPSVFANPYVTIAAQTAPGKGICLQYCNISLANESIARHLRLKRGFGGWGVTGNACGMNNDHTIMDHCTAAWGTDETLSTRGAKNITFQYSMIAEALTETGHSKQCEEQGRQDVWHGYAATIDGQTGSYSHNMLVNCEGRNWSMGGGMSGDMHPIGSLDMRNNVCYNWWSRTTDGGCHQAQFVNNYYKMGPDTKHTVLFSQNYENIGAADAMFQAYVSGNIRENKNGTLSTDKLNDTYEYTLSNGATDPNTRSTYQYKTFVDEPFFESYVTTHTAKDAFKIVTSTSGATMPCRDNQHKRVMNEAITGTTTYVGSLCKVHGEIDTEADITGEANNGWEEWPEETRAADYDTDQDGMPNWWEQIISSDPNTANNNDDPDHDGWTLLEDYINFIAHPYVVVEPNGTATFDASQEFAGFTKSPVFTVSTDSKLFSATVSGSTITVTASTSGGVGTVNMTVTDSEGSTYTQPLGVAITGEPTAIKSVTSDNYKVAKREVYTLDGKRVKTFKAHGTYILKDTDTEGHVHTMKAIKD